MPEDARKYLRKMVASFYVDHFVVIFEQKFYNTTI
jgi:hypothetical protein